MAPLEVPQGTSGVSSHTGIFPAPSGPSWVRVRSLERRGRCGVEKQTVPSKVCTAEVTGGQSWPWMRERGSTENVTFDPGGSGFRAVLREKQC